MKTNETYINGSEYGQELLNQFKKSQKIEGYELEYDRLINKFNSEGSINEDAQDTVKRNLSDLYGE